MKKPLLPVTATIIAAFLFIGACGDDEDDGDNDRRESPEQTGKSCESADQCFPDVDKSELKGDVLCMAEVRDGYCTHTCQIDGDCCAAEGECQTTLKQVCSPFTSTAGMRCFLSCEPEDLRPAEGQSGPVNDQEYCQREASQDFICRSSGGSNDNRKICVPGDCGVGASCDDAADCDAGQECLTNFRGGYCGKKDCNVNADCPENSRCVEHGDRNYCFVTCEADTNCSFCRSRADATSCASDVEFADSTTTSGTRVCVPTAR